MIPMLRCSFSLHKTSLVRFSSRLNLYDSWKSIATQLALSDGLMNSVVQLGGLALQFIQQYYH
jgi:hypothetical protein